MIEGTENRSRLSVPMNQVTTPTHEQANQYAEPRHPICIHILLVDIMRSFMMRGNARNHATTGAYTRS
ncbi:MAG: hypothetical protein ACTSUE_25785 [Promethearchaeota archaeon]